LADENDGKDSVYPQNEYYEVDLYPKEKYEQLFEGVEKNSYKIFCRNMTFCPPPTRALEDTSNPSFCTLPTHAMEDASSPFAGEDDEIDQKFDSFLAEFPDEEMTLCICD